LDEARFVAVVRAEGVHPAFELLVYAAGADGAERGQGKTVAQSLQVFEERLVLIAELLDFAVPVGVFFKNDGEVAATFLELEFAWEGLEEFIEYDDDRPAGSIVEGAVHKIAEVGQEDVLECGIAAEPQIRQWNVRDHGLTCGFGRKGCGSVAANTLGLKSS
jgi:hypothetical protein